MEQQEFLYDNDYSGAFADIFGSDVLVVEGDGVEMDVYETLTYTGVLGLTELGQITIPKEESTVVGAGERQGQFDPGRVAENKQRSDVPRRRAEKSADHHRTRDKVRIRP